MLTFFITRSSIARMAIIATAALFASRSHAQTTYYYKGTGALATTTNWGTNTDGTGTAPTNFTTANRIYEIRNTTAVTLGTAWTVSGLLSKVTLGNAGVAGVALTISSGVTLTGTIDLAAASSGSNTLILQNTTFPTFGTINGGSTVQYDGAGTQTVTATTYGNLVISNAGVKTLAGATAVVAGLTVNAGATLNAAALVISRSGAGTANIIINGTLNTSNTNGFSGATNTTINSTGTAITLGSSSTIGYTSASSQSITARTDYANVTLSGASTKTTQGTTTLSGAINVTAGTFTNNQVLTVAAYYGTGTYTSASGTLNVAGFFSDSGTATLTGTSTVHYNGTSAQSVRSLTYANLSFSNSGVKTFAGSVAITAGRTLLINSGAIVNAGTNQVTSTGATATITINGTFMTADPDGLSGSASTAISSTNTTISPFTTTSTINYTATSGNQVVTVFSPDSIYANLVLSGGSLKTTAANFYMLGGTSFTLDAGTIFNMGTRSIKRSGASGTVTFNFNGTLYTALAAGFSGTTSTMVSSTGTVINLGAASVINYTKSTAQTISARNDYAILRLNGAGVKTLDGVVTVNDSFNLMESELVLASGGLILKNKAGGAGFITGSSTSSITFDGASAGSVLSLNQASSATRTLNNLTINRPGGVTMNSAVDVAGVLTLTSGALAMNGQTLTLAGTVSSAGGTITGSSTSSMVINGAGAFGSIPFTSGSEVLNNLTINRTSSGSVTLGSDLLLASTGTLTFTAGKLNIGSNTLTVNGNISGMSSSSCFSFNGSSGIVIGGSGAISSTFFCDQASTTTRSVNNFTLNRTSSTLTLGNALLLVGTLSLNNGTFTTGSNLTLVSNASGTARIAAITGTGAISGSVIAQRYIPEVARRWRFMSSCITGTTLEDWRNEIYITGSGTGNTAGTLNSNGFDATVNNAPGVYYYNETASGGSNTGWVGITNTTSSLTNVPLVTGRGYRVFVRGDRSDVNRLTDNNSVQNEVLMDLVGTVNTGNISIPVSYTNTGSPADDGWCLVGNPYPCQFDWNAFYDDGTNYTNIDPTIYVYDPSSNSYKSYNANSSGTLTNGIIAQGQAFFVKATGAFPSLTFKESFKAASVPLYLYKKTQSDELHMRLSAGLLNYDDYILKFMGPASAHHDGYDIVAMQGAINISSYSSDSIYHALDARPALSVNDTVFMKINTPAGVARFTFSQVPNTTGKYFFLYDLFLDSIQPLAAASEYAFTVQPAVPATSGNKRFRLIISNHPGLPVKLLQFEVAKEGNRVKLQWKTASETNSSHFEIERSADLLDFYRAGSVKASGNTTAVRAYEFMDEAPLNGQTRYYRLKQVDANHQYVYSETRAIGADMNGTALLSQVWPNPASHIINIKPHKQLSTIDLYSISGRPEFSKRLDSFSAADLRLNVSSVSSGIYMLKLNYADGEQENVKVVIR